MVEMSKMEDEGALLRGKGKAGDSGSGYRDRSQIPDLGSAVGSRKRENYWNWNCEVNKCSTSCTSLDSSIIFIFTAVNFRESSAQSRTVRFSLHCTLKTALFTVPSS